MPRQKKQVLKKNKDGLYRCKYKGKFFSSAISSDDALEKRQQYIDAERAGLIESYYVGEYANKWIDRAFPKVADSTKVGLKIHLKKLTDSIGDKTFDEVRPSDIKQIYADHYKDASNSYIKAARQLYCSLFDAAVADRYITINPAREKTAKPHTGNIGGHRAITSQEREWILTYCKGHRAYPAIITMLYAGIRPQEAKALTIEKAYDPEKKILHITETAHRDGNNQYKITEEMKTDKSSRDVPVFQPVEEALKGKKGLLITTAKGKQITSTTWRNAIESYRHCMETAINGIDRRWYRRTKAHKKILAEAEALRKEGKTKEAEAKEKEIPEWKEFTVVPYDLRHSFCTMCRDADPPVEIKTCIRWMGHADAKMILKIYDEASDTRSEKEAERLNKTLFGST